jgi:integrase
VLGAGVPVHVVSAMLGHANVRITQNIYWHALPDDTQGAAATFAAHLSAASV